jgi:hypothetical protein
MVREAAGQAQGGPADASLGMTIQNDDRGSWAWNALQGQWQLLHVVVSGDTLWNLTRTYYGAGGQNLASVRAIGQVPQNEPILGPEYRDAVPGDVILIPNLEQPGAAPPSPPPGGALPPPGGDPVPQPDEPPLGGAPQPIPELPAQPPPGWPPTMPWPPVLVTPEPGDEPPGPLPGEGPIDEIGPPTIDPGIPPGVEPIPVGAIVPAEPESWWTTGRIALVGGLSLATVGLIVWGATRGAKRRRRAPRRRRRR